MPLQLHLLRVFCDPDGRAGNRLGAFLCVPTLSTEQRQQIAAQLGFSETVFVEEAAQGRLRIHTPTTELSLAGHPLLGAAWLLTQTGFELRALNPPAGPVSTWQDEELTWIAADPATAPDFELRRLEGPDYVDALPGPPAGSGLVMAWAWIDQEAGRVRARVFAPMIGVDEDPATGSAALRLAASLRRPITIIQGAGSHLYAQPRADGCVEVGGRVVLDRVADYEL